MSDNNIPTPAATTPAPVTVATKAPKSKGLSIYNRVALVLLLVLIIATTTLFTFAVQKTKAQKNMQDEIQTITEQTAALAAPAWCEQVTPDNVDKIDELYSKYDGMSSAARDAVDEKCKDRVETVRLLKFQNAKGAFKVEPTCALDDAQTTVHCTVDISPASDTVKDKLATYPTTDLTLRIRFADSQFYVGPPHHVVDDALTATVPNGEKVTVEFTTPFDPSWGDKFGVDVTSYFPNA